jgi:hypothetical protein
MAEGVRVCVSRSDKHYSDIIRVSDPYLFDTDPDPEF